MESFSGWNPNQHRRRHLPRRPKIHITKSPQLCRRFSNPVTFLSNSLSLPSLAEHVPSAGSASEIAAVPILDTLASVLNTLSPSEPKATFRRSSAMTEARLTHPHAKVAAAMVDSARRWVASLDRSQRDKATYHYLDGERIFWYYPPLNRHGLPLRDMTEQQRTPGPGTAGHRPHRRDQPPGQPHHRARVGARAPWKRSGTRSHSSATLNCTTGPSSATRAVPTPGAGASRDTTCPSTTASGATRSSR